MKITKANAGTIHDDINDALCKVAAKHGLTFVPSGVRYNASTLTGRFELKVTVEGDSTEPADFASHARMLGLPPDCYGKTFRHQGATYTITGIVLRRRSYPVSASGPQGGSYKFPVSIVRNALAGASPLPPRGTSARAHLGLAHDRDEDSRR